MTDASHHASTSASDWASLSLAAGGRSLIEASAGTGKTWTISVLYLRLLLEVQDGEQSPLTPRQIVVATFTDAAAQELRARIRSRLIWAEQCAMTALSSERIAVAEDAAPDAVWLHTRWIADPETARRDLQRLRLALAELDMAPISTLHGLCRRILSDFPFESGSSFSLGEMIDSQSMFDELADDLWRRLQQGATDPPSLKSTSSRQALGRRLAECMRPGVDLWAPDNETVKRVFSTDAASRIDAFAAQTNVWSLTPGGKPQSTLRASLQALANWLRNPTEFPTDKQFEHLANRQKLLHPDRIEELLADPVMQEVGKILRVLGYYQARDEIRSWQAWLKDIREQRDQRLAATGRLTFDELLTRVYAALTSRSRDLADRLFAEWKVALIDEFQDTDAQQYTILDRIYRDANDAPRGRLVMIGDPKQAIYRFRGGDINTYLAAQRDVESRLELEVNFRSSRGYVAAVNEFFERAGEALSTDPDHPIRFHAVKASGRCDARPYHAPAGEAEKPLVIHYHPEAPDSASERQSLALDACADQIASMLTNADYRIGERRVEPGDIAVLLPSNRQIAELRERLQQRNVPCVGAGKASVFETEAAHELQIVLYAVEHWNDESAVRAALATRLGGLDFLTLDKLRDAPQEWQQHAARFAEMHRLWQREGVLAVVLSFAQAAVARLHDVSLRERTLTDLRHLGELLQAQSEHVQGPAQLLLWLSKQRSGEDDSSGEGADEQQLRIESDAKRVRLMTLHASKGLEFPIVFLPLMWNHVKNRNDTTAIIHEPLCGRRVIGYGEDALQQYDREGQDERFRVLYVAITRAVYACHVYAFSPDRRTDGRSKNPLGDPQRSALDALIARLQKRNENASFEHFAWIEKPWRWQTTRYQPAADSSTVALRVLPTPPSTTFEQAWSFSSLTRLHTAFTREEEAADDEGLNLISPTTDSEIESANKELELSDAPHVGLQNLAMLKGPGFGNALHAIFEERDGNFPLREQGRLIMGAMNEMGVRLGDLAPSVAVTRIAERLEEVLACEIMPGMSLGGLSKSRQRAEMAFHFQLEAVSMRALRDVAARHGDGALVPSGIPATRLQGLMTGKIDLVFEHNGRFHVLDYKSNYLGVSLADYSPGAVAVAMDAHHYRFQALLYTVAVDRYLRQRIPNYERARHLGDAIYLFVRAVGLAPSAGIWRHRFTDALVADVDAVLGAAHEERAA
jgi:exodeoxyribonuclease V beta subunit